MTTDEANVSLFDEVKRLQRENAALRKEFEAERHRYTSALNEWLDKTEWVQKTSKPNELGLHRADVILNRLTNAEEECDQLKAILQGVEKSDYRFSVEQLAEHDAKVIGKFAEDLESSLGFANPVDLDSVFAIIQHHVVKLRQKAQVIK